MDPNDKFADLKALARMATRLAGREPAEHVEIRIGDKLVFRDVVWRYRISWRGPRRLMSCCGAVLVSSYLHFRLGC
jgi:hypothetical protein